MECASSLLINDDPLNITEDHKEKENLNDKSNRVSPEENNIINDDYILNPSFSLVEVKLNDDSWNSNNEVNNTIDDASILNPLSSLVRKKTIDESMDNKTIIYDIPKDMQNMYKYVNNLHQNSMPNSNEIKHILDVINQLTNRLNVLENKFEANIPDLASRILLIEIDKEQTGNLTKKEKESIHRKINENNTRIGNINKFETSYENLQTEHSENFKEINKSIETLESIVKEIQSAFKKNIQGETHRKKFKQIDYSETRINDEVILIVASNLGRVNTKILNHGSTCEKFLCPTLRHVDEFLNKVTIVKQPEVIFVHTGTNHLDEPDFNIEKLEMDYVDVIFKLKMLCPNSKIIVSSLLPRKEIPMKMTITSINDFLLGVCCNTKKLQFMRNVNIKQHMLVDKKHVDDNGFKTLLSNIRYTIFGRVPSYKMSVKYY